MGWEIASPGSLEELTHDIVEEHAWMAVVSKYLEATHMNLSILTSRCTVNQGATSALHAARASGDTTYDPSTAVTLYVEAARNNNAVGQLIVPLSTALLESVSYFF